MKAFAWNMDNDIFIENKEFVMKEGDEQLAQEADLSLSIAKGEWFLDEEEGLNMDSIVGKHINEDEARADIIEALMNTSEELIAESIDFSPNVLTRKMNIVTNLKKADTDSNIISEVNI